MEWDEIYEDFDQFCCEDCALYTPCGRKKGQCDQTGRAVHPKQEACPDFMPDD